MDQAKDDLRNDGDEKDVQDDRRPWIPPTVQSEEVDSVTEGGPFAGTADDALYRS